MLAFNDAPDGYYEFSDNADPSMYAHLTPCALRVPIPPTAQQRRDAVQSQIDALEILSKMNRFVREWAILASVQQAAASGITEPQLYIANSGYKQIKDVNTQIVGLRNQMMLIV